MSRKRRSYEAGHKAKFLVIIDDTSECDRAVYFASRRAARVGVSVVMLRVIETHDHSQQWLGVADIMQAEAQEEANAMLAKFAARSNGIAGITPESVIREGEPHEEIAVLILAAGVESEGPGPLVTSLSKIAGSFPIPIAIVPGHLSDEDLDA